MHVEVIDRLAAVWADIDHNTEPLREALCVRHVVGRQEQMPEQRFIGWLRYGEDGSAWYDA